MTRFAGGICSLILILAACGDLSVPTDTPEFSRAPSLAPSQEFLPVIPTVSEDEAIGRSDPTMAALAAEGEPSTEPSIESVDVENTFFSFQFFADDRTLLFTPFYGASNRPAPSIILFHDVGQSSNVWSIPALQFQDAGFNVFVPELRNHNLSEAEISWQQILADSQLVFQNVTALPDITNGQFLMMGIGTGANISLSLCAITETCLGIVLINPRPNLVGLDTTNIASAYLTRSVLLVSTDDDIDGTNIVSVLSSQLSGDITWQRYPQGGRGVILLGFESDLPSRLTTWAQQRLNPALNPTPTP